MRKFALSTAMILCGVAAVPVLATPVLTAKAPAAVAKTQASEEAERRAHVRHAPGREQAPHGARAVRHDKDGKQALNPEREEDRDDD